MWVQTNLEVGGNSVMYNALTVWGGIYGLNGCQVQWSCPSDVRLKKNIEPIENALDAIDQLHGVRYDWRREEYPERDFSQRRQIGLIAQDVQKVAPEVVTTDKSGYLGVDYEKLVPLLIEGMKEQQQRIEKLEETIRRMQP